MNKEEVADVVISFVSRTIFASGIWAPNPRVAPVLLVCEEAHRYVPCATTAQALPLLRCGSYCQRGIHL